ncbi:DNA-processing protein DprA [Peribacillus asahii]|uniref:DNA-processing protein DprA n=1 Tax=Peribacillus asahii TaxID=228899 RepID=UPI003827FE45
MNPKDKLIHLHHCRGAGWKTIQAIVQVDPLLSSLFTKSYAEWKDIVPLPSNKLQMFFRDLHSLSIMEKLRRYEECHIQCLTMFDEEYPYLLQQIFDPPWVLYMIGRKELLKEQNTLAIVGTRTPTTYGLGALKTILPKLVEKNFTIISGVAAGIDAAAHMVTLNEGGKTIGVLGGGLMHIYPKRNVQLAETMMKQGLLLSEIPPMRRAEPWMFPVRNRIISGLSRGVLVIEARKRSGTLITAQAALEQGRDVYALPGNILSPQSTGTNQLIQDGAKLVLAASDIEEEYANLF